MRRSSAIRWAPAAVLVAAAAIAGVAMLGDDEPGPVEVESSASEFDSLGELIAASDLVVVATVTEVDDGRTITAPDDPDAGIHTRLVRLDVREVLAGETAVAVVVEEAATFADGSPIEVDGMSRLRDGDVAIWFLVAGGSDAMPYFAAVNGQARFVVVGETLEPSGSDELSRALAALGAGGLADAVRNRR
jgi:hypothetical protein